MWGLKGKHYWGRKERGEVEGIVVVFAWLSSQERHLKSYVDLYSSLGWNSLICPSHFLNLFFPDKAASLALEIVTVLAEELKFRPCPIVFASFSGGPKACMYKVLQIIESRSQNQVSLVPPSQNQDDFRLVKDCVSGFIFDSSPVDFTSDLGTRFVLHPTVLKTSRPPLLASWSANCVASTLDTLFLGRFESQRAEYWQTLYASVSMQAPYLILCSEDDDLAPCQIICNFAQRLQKLGGDVKLVKWSNSVHVGHYRYHQNEYQAAVTELLEKAAVIYSRRIQQLEGEKIDLNGGQDEISEPLSALRKAAAAGSSIKSYQRIDPQLNDYFLVPSSVEYHEDRDAVSVKDEFKERIIPVSSRPSINAHGVLGQILFDVCVPKNVEDWDIRSPSSYSRVVSARRHSTFNPIKCILRSRL